jgi:hypothetical protein
MIVAVDFHRVGSKCSVVHPKMAMLAPRKNERGTAGCPRSGDPTPFEDCRLALKVASP